MGRKGREGESEREGGGERGVFPELGRSDGGREAGDIVDGKSALVRCIV